MRKLLVVALIWTLCLMACQKIDDPNVEAPPDVRANTMTDCNNNIKSVRYFQNLGYEVVLVPDLRGYLFARDTGNGDIYAVETGNSNWCEEYVKVKIFK